MKDFFDLLTAISSLIVIVAGAWWAFEQWRRRDEHFPRVYFEIFVRFVGFQGDDVVAEIVAKLENKGVVPLRIRHFLVAAKIINRGEVINVDPRIRNQIRFDTELVRGEFVPATWEYSFVYPGVSTEYTFVTKIPKRVAFVRVAASFDYLINGESHHVARVFRVPETDAELAASAVL